MINRYRIQTGSVYEYDCDHNGYVHIGRVTQYNKSELKLMATEKCEEDSHTIDDEEE